MLSLPHTGFDMGNMAGVLQEAETPHSSEAPESTPVFWWDPCLVKKYQKDIWKILLHNWIWYQALIKDIQKASNKNQILEEKKRNSEI